MNPTEILFPVVALVGWTLLVLLLIPYQRFKAAFEGRVTMEDFKVGESSRVPQGVSIPNRNFMNLLEAPVLFYVVCLTQFVAQKVDVWAVYLAWAFVVTRVLHSLVHLVYNRMSHRIAFFGTSNVILIVAWIHLVLALRG
ncbi:MAG: MAPEG family protein [Panacagrimonas sp.]